MLEQKVVVLQTISNISRLDGSSFYRNNMFSPLSYITYKMISVYFSYVHFLTPINQSTDSTGVPIFSESRQGNLYWMATSADPLGEQCRS